MTFNPPSSRSLKFEHVRYFENGDTYDDGVSGSWIENHPWAIDWHHDLWPWTILDLGHRIFPSNILNTVRDTMLDTFFGRRARKCKQSLSIFYMDVWVCKQTICISMLLPLCCSLRQQYHDDDDGDNFCISVAVKIWHEHCVLCYCCCVRVSWWTVGFKLWEYL